LGKLRIRRRRSLVDLRFSADNPRQKQHGRYPCRPGTRNLGPPLTSPLERGGRRCGGHRGCFASRGIFAVTHLARLAGLFLCPHARPGARRPCAYSGPGQVCASSHPQATPLRQRPQTRPRARLWDGRGAMSLLTSIFGYSCFAVIENLLSFVVAVRHRRDEGHVDGWNVLRSRGNVALKGSLPVGIQPKKLGATVHDLQAHLG